MASARILREVRASDATDEYVLCFQYVCLHYDDGTEQHGYRFIWNKPDGKYSTRGQALIPTMATLLSLISKAMDEGWGDITDGAKFAEEVDKEWNS